MMNICDIRFRNEGLFVVLQVCEKNDYNCYQNYNNEKWRDAKTEDLLEVSNIINKIQK
jgi:hypothetical protein